MSSPEKKNPRCAAQSTAQLPFAGLEAVRQGRSDLRTGQADLGVSSKLRPFIVWSPRKRMLKRDSSSGRFYLRFPRNWSGRWEMSLRRGSPEGPEVCEIRKGNSLKDSFTVVWPYVFPSPESSRSTRLQGSLNISSRAHNVRVYSEGLETECRKRSHFNTQYEFEGSEKYRWRADSLNKSMYNYTVRTFDLFLPCES